MFNELLSGIRKHLALAAAIVAAVALGAGGAVALAWASGAMSDSDPSAHVVDVSRLTPEPFTGYPSTIEVPDYDNPPKCQLPDDERPDSRLPPLSCRNSGAEPRVGAIPTAPVEAHPMSSPVAGFSTVDNRLFRFTFTIPDGWYSDMRPEGGAFAVYDPEALAAGRSIDSPGGLMLIFSATSYSPPSQPAFAGPIEQHLANPNAKFGPYSGAVWDEGPGEALAHFIHAVFIRDGILYQVDAHVSDGGRPLGSIAADFDRAIQLIGTILPY